MANDHERSRFYMDAVAPMHLLSDVEPAELERLLKEAGVIQ